MGWERKNPKAASSIQLCQVWLPTQALGKLHAGLCSNRLRSSLLRSLPPGDSLLQDFSVPPPLNLPGHILCQMAPGHSLCLLFSHDKVDSELAYVGLCLKLMGPTFRERWVTRSAAVVRDEQGEAGAALEVFQHGGLHCIQSPSPAWLCLLSVARETREEKGVQFASQGVWRGCAGIRKHGP